MSMEVLNRVVVVSSVPTPRGGTSGPTLPTASARRTPLSLVSVSKCSILVGFAIIPSSPVR